MDNRTNTLLTILNKEMIETKEFAIAAAKHPNHAYDMAQALSNLKKNGIILDEDIRIQITENPENARSYTNQLIRLKNVTALVCQGYYNKINTPANPMPTNVKIKTQINLTLFETQREEKKEEKTESNTTKKSPKT